MLQGTWQISFDNVKGATVTQARACKTKKRKEAIYSVCTHIQYSDKIATFKAKVEIHAIQACVTRPPTGAVTVHEYSQLCRIF